MRVLKMPQNVAEKIQTSATSGGCRFRPAEAMHVLPGVVPSCWTPIEVTDCRVIARVLGLLLMKLGTKTQCWMERHHHPTATRGHMLLPH